MIERREEKSASISLIRMVAMSFIIICHIFQTYDNELAWWFNVGVQIFLIISGYLYCSKNYSIGSPLKILKKQFKKILIPYYLWIAIVILIYIFLSPETLSVNRIVSSLFCSGTLVGQGHLWYIPYILFCYIITPYLFWIKSKIRNTNLKNSILTWLVILAFLLVISTFYKSYFKPDIISCYILGYAIADLFDRFENIKKKTTLIILFISIIFNTIKICLQYIYNFELDGIFNIAFSYFKSYSHVILGLSIFLTLLYLCKGIRYYKILSLSDKISYEIYLVHALFILSPLNLLFLTNIVWINILVSVLCTMISGIFLNYISSKFNSVNFK